MITISVSEVRAFFQRSKSIKENKILPILAYIKFEYDGETCTLTKNSMASFVIHEVEAEVAKKIKNIKVLLDERSLSSIIENAPSDAILTIESTSIKKDNIDTNKVHMVCGKKKMDFFAPFGENFPAPEKQEKTEVFVLDKTVLKALAAAADHSDPIKDVRTWLMYAYIFNLGAADNPTHYCVWGGDGQVMYYKEFDKPLPHMVLEPAACNVICQYDQVEFSQSGKYYFFGTGKSIYGFAQPEAAYRDISPIVALKKEGNVTLDRAEIIEFCQMVIGNNPTEYGCEGIIKNEGKRQLKFVYDNAQFSKYAEMILDVKKDFDIDEFIFNAKAMLTVMKSIDSDKVQFHKPIQHNIFVTVKDDKSYLGAVRQLVYNQSQPAQSE